MSAEVLTLDIHLIGKPVVLTSSGEPYRPRSRKTWGLLCYLLLTESSPSRRQLSSLLYSEAEDPLRALRWNLSELRRLLGPAAGIDGDPVSLRLPEGAQIDVRLLSEARWPDALEVPSLGHELLEGFDSLGSAQFETWLLVQRRRVAAATESVLREACLSMLGRGEPAQAIRWAAVLVGLDPFNESHQTLLIKAYALSGDAVAAHRQLQVCIDLFESELGSSPGPAVRLAATLTPGHAASDGDTDAARAAIEAGTAAISAGATNAGITALRSGLGLADSNGEALLAATARLSLAEALVHTVRGEDEEGAELLHGAIELARVNEISSVEATAEVELGYIDMLAGRYDRAIRWLQRGMATGSDAGTLIRAVIYLGVVKSDIADYAQAEELLEDAVRRARSAQESRREAYALSMVGRMAHLTGDHERARDLLSQSISLAERDNWLAFVPWPQAFLGEVMVARGDVEDAERVLNQGFARACQIGDPCWEGVTGRGRALVAEAQGDRDAAFEALDDALERCRRMSDTYCWAAAYILEARCRLGVAHGHAMVGSWIAELIDITSGTGMREILLRGLLLAAEHERRPNDPTIISLAESVKNPAIPGNPFDPGG